MDDRVTKYCGLFIVLSSLTVIAGWVWEIEILKTVGPGFPSMKFNTALGFMLSGTLIVIYEREIPRYIMAISLIILAGASLFENLSSANLGIDQLFVSDDSSSDAPGLMSSGTALNFLFFGISFLFIKNHRLILRKVSQHLLLLVSAISLFAILGFIYGISDSDRLVFISSMAIHTSVLFGLCSVAASLINPNLGLIDLLNGSAPGNILARRMFPTLIFTVALIGYILTNWLKQGIISDSTTIILFGLIVLAVALVSVAVIAVSLNISDEARLEAEMKLKDINLNLEEKINDRTSRLKETLDLLQETNRVGKVGGWDIDLVSKKVTWTPVTKMIHDVTMEYVPDMDKGISFYKQGTSRAQISRAINDAISLRRSWDLELQIVTSTGKEKWVRVIGKPIFTERECVRLTGTFQDIDSRKTAEINANKEREFLQTIIDNIPVNIYVKDKNFRKVLANKEEAKFLGYDNASDILGEDDFKYYPEDIAKAFTDQDRHVLETGEPILGRETKIKMQDESLRWILISKIPLFDNENKTTGILGVGVDITDRKNDEVKLQNYAILEAKSKEMEEFAYVASHDLREPLLAIKNYLDLLLEEFSPQLVKGGDSDRYIRSIVKGVVRMDDLINGLLDYSRLSKTRTVEQVDIQKTIKEVIEDLNPIIANTESTITIDGILPKISGYSVLIRSLFQNLISNAIKFKRADTPPIIEINSKKIKDGYRFEVKDNGIGISEKDTEQIFVIFRRLHRQDEYPGTGIGLAQCRKITELHNGRIWAEPNIDEGSTFYFTLKNL